MKNKKRCSIVIHNIENTFDTDKSFAIDELTGIEFRGDRSWVELAQISNVVLAANEGTFGLDASTLRGKTVEYQLNEDIYELDLEHDDNGIKIIYPEDDFNIGVIAIATGAVLGKMHYVYTQEDTVSESEALLRAREASENVRKLIEEWLLE